MGGGLPDPAVAAVVIAGGYLAGSMPFGYWLVRLVKHDDIRRHGSGNIGATNVWRVYGRWLGVPVVLVDVLKGFVPAFLPAPGEHQAAAGRDGEPLRAA